jgi:hypothetical protein
MKKLIVCLAIMVFLAGCALPPVAVKLYGVSGPSEGTVIQGLAHRTGRNTGTIEITLPSKEHCTGDYTVITQGSSSVATAQWAGLYQSVYGTGFSTTKQATGQGMGTAIGTAGTVLEVNFMADTLTGHGFGVAKDNRGNIYRVQF